MRLLLAVALAYRLGQLAHLLGEPGHRGRRAASAVAVTEGSFDDVLQFTKVHLPIIAPVAHFTPMSTTPPPPPPPSSAPPPGYTPYGGMGTGAPLRPSAGLSKAMVILYWSVVATGALLAFAFFNRKSAVEDFLNGSASDFDSADAMLGLAVILQVLLMLAAAIVTCLWAKRIADNAKARGVMNVSPGLAAGGWFIPIGWFFVGFNELRKSVKGVNGSAPNLNFWQAAFIAQTIVGFFNLNNDDVYLTDSDALDQLNSQGIVGLVAMAVLAVAAFFAMKAAKEINSAVSGS